jgi:hypothetical protein
MLLHESFVPFIDMMNNSEKIMILRSADKMIEIRDLRYQIAHEYIPEAIRELVPEVINLSSDLIDNIKDCQNFLESRRWIKSTLLTKNE